MSFGIYIHIPFCRSRCNYCHFLTMADREEMMERYAGAVIREIKAFPGAIPSDEVDSIYFGGGTPSLMPPEYVEAIIIACRELFSVSETAEISLEANPGTVLPGKAAIYRRAGVNRISLGAQSFNDGELASIGRGHDAAMIFESLARLSEAGISQINMDLMLGLPMQTAGSWRNNLERVKRARVAHVSVYMLDLDEQCALGEAVLRGSARLPDEELVADLYEETVEFMASCGYRQYEISNFARDGHICRHNMKYWKREKTQGFGLGSHSFDLCSRSANCDDMDDYLRLVEQGISPVKWRETVAPRQALQEKLFLGLRLTEGVDWSRLRSDDKSGFLDGCEHKLKELSLRGLVEWNNDTVRLTVHGMLLSNEILQMFVE
ncbi:MAG TPA: radical SAM family heme chaperone HemW [Acidobacteriota bacterium]|nr:radical SAM family heme chaperone HemW [Acidobacteriota bacterium]